MNLSKLIIATATAMLLTDSCADNAPLVNSGLEEHYTIARMQKLLLSTPLSGHITWRCTLPDGSTSVISTAGHAVFVAAEAGTYTVELTVESAGGSLNSFATVTVVEEEVAYSPYISEVTDFSPAPGQFVNIMPQWSEGDTREDMRRKATEAVGGTVEELISLGSFGGYVVFRFDHTVVNRPGKPDFYILSNSFFEDNEVESSSDSGSSEPGIVSVALDRNGNGIPDPDEWFELAGSDYASPLSRHNLSITYHPPVPGKAPVPQRPFITDAEYIRWSDSGGYTGYVPKNNQHRQEYFPQWLPAEPITFSNLSQLPPNGEDVYGNGLYFRFKFFEWGYADNRPNSDAAANSFDIDNAVDSLGVPAYLPGIDFVRVHTAMNQYCGRLGESSTEICGAGDLSLTPYPGTSSITK